VVPFSVLHSPVRKYKLTSEGRHSLRLARLAIGEPVPAPALRPGGVIRSLWWRSGVSSRPTFASQTPAATSGPQLICSSSGEGHVFPEFSVGLPACRSEPTARAGSQQQPDSPASTSIIPPGQLDRGIGSLLHLESQPAGHWPGPWPSPIAPSPILPNRSKGPPQPSPNGRRTPEQQRP
jgi:hypothetical protein